MAPANIAATVGPAIIIPARRYGYAGVTVPNLTEGS